MDKFRLHNELHARPLPEIHLGSTVLHLAYFRGPVSIAEEKEHLDRLASKLSASVMKARESHQLLTIGGCSLPLRD